MVVCSLSQSENEFVCKLLPHPFPLPLFLMENFREGAGVAIFQPNDIQITMEEVLPAH